MAREARLCCVILLRCGYPLGGVSNASGDGAGGALMDELDAFGRALRARVQMRGILAVLAATLLLLPAAAAAEPLPYTITVTPAPPYVLGETIYPTTNAPSSPQDWFRLECWQAGVKVESTERTID